MTSARKTVSREAAKIALVIPARNEADSLETLLPRIPGWVDRLIVVDNDSSDATSAVAARLGAVVLHEPRVGYGAACAKGLSDALSNHAEMIVFMDADGSDDPAEMHSIVEPLLEGAADLVIGRRNPVTPMPWHQRLGTRAVCQVLSLGFGCPVGDLGPFRAARADLLGTLALADRGFGWTAQMQAQALRRGARIREVPVLWRPGQGRSEITGTPLGVARAARDLIGLSLREILGYHRDRLFTPGASREEGFSTRNPRF